MSQTPYTLLKEGVLKATRTLSYHSPPQRKEGGEVILAYIKEGKTNDKKEPNFGSFFHLSPVNCISD